MSMIDEKAAKVLIKQILDGKTDAFKEVIANYQRLVNHIIFKMVKDDSEREDLCQDVFLKVFDKLGSFKFESKLSTWIAQIAYHRSLNFLEKKKVELYSDFDTDNRGLDSLDGNYITPAEYAEQTDRKDRIASEIDQLPPAYRTVISLYHLEEMTYDEIGKVMKLKPGTIKSHLFRARKQLKQLLLKRYTKEDIYI